MNVIRKTVIAAGLAATALAGTAASTTPAMARDWHRGRDDTAAVAIGAGILGLAVGAIAASSGRDRHRDRYYDTYRDGYYDSRDHYRGGHYRDRDDDWYSRDAYYGYRGDDRRRGYGRDWGDWRRGY